MDRHGINPNGEVILIVDDELSSLNLLNVILTLQGYETLMANSGELCLEEAQKGIDLILLDIMMPGMDGFETCRLLKENPATQQIPVIFLSALEEVSAKTNSFVAGGIDYIRKPFDKRELLARVKTHLTLRNQHRQLQHYAQKLEQMVEKRTRQLVHADRLVTLGTFSAAIVHEINNPLMFISGQTELLEMILLSVKQPVAGCTNDSGYEEIVRLVTKAEMKLKSISEGTTRIAQLVSRLNSYGKQGTSENTRHHLHDPIRDAIQLLHSRIKRGVEIHTDIPPDMEIYANRQKMEQVFVNLFNNSMDAIPDHAGVISITGEQNDGQCYIWIHDNGPGIPDDIADNIFDPFFTSKAHTGGTGLGLFIVHQIIEEHGGSIRLLPQTEGGTTFEINLPTGTTSLKRGLSLVSDTIAAQCAASQLHCSSSGTYRSSP